MAFRCVFVSFFLLVSTDGERERVENAKRKKESLCIYSTPTLSLVCYSLFLNTTLPHLSTAARRHNCRIPTVSPMQSDAIQLPYILYKSRRPFSIIAVIDIPPCLDHSPYLIITIPLSLLSLSGQTPCRPLLSTLLS